MGGWRPTHGLISLTDVPVNAPTCDVIGVLANSLPILESVALSYGCQPDQVADLWQLCDPAISRASVAKLGRQAGMEMVQASLAELFAPMTITIDVLTSTFLHIGMYEVASTSAGA